MPNCTFKGVFACFQTGGSNNTISSFNKPFNDCYFPLFPVLAFLHYDDVSNVWVAQLIFFPAGW